VEYRSIGLGSTLPLAGAIESSTASYFTFSK